jgi:hypothetical protein
MGPVLFGFARDSSRPRRSDYQLLFCHSEESFDFSQDKLRDEEALR